MWMTDCSQGWYWVRQYRLGTSMWLIFHVSDWLSGVKADTELVNTGGLQSCDWYFMSMTDCLQARLILSKAVQVEYKHVDDLASVWCEWAEMELRHEWVTSTLTQDCYILQWVLSLCPPPPTPSSSLPLLSFFVVALFSSPTSTPSQVLRTWVFSSLHNFNL